MLPPLPVFRQAIKNTIAANRAEGHEVDGFHEALNALPDSYDALLDFARRLAATPLRADWPYVEPHALEDIWSECDPTRPRGPIGTLSPEDAAACVEMAFLSSVCGCILGKPLEINPTLAEIRSGLEAIGEWPMRDYIPQRINMRGTGACATDAATTWRETIQHVAPDDDIHYTILGMLNLEQHGSDFTWDQLRRMWLKHQTISYTWGPERTVMARVGLQHWASYYGGDDIPVDYVEWTHLCNPSGELCGALIRADAYGYAAAGNPELAAAMAWRDATFTHRRTGVYGTMFVAAAIAAAFVERDRLRVFEIALQFVPQRSRFYQIVSDSLAQVRDATDWLDAYGRIHGRYAEYSHCKVYQECGTLINTLRFAEDIGDGICKQVSQGNDTDSSGATAGSILGAYFGPGHLEPRWLAPFNDDIRVGLAQFYDHSLSGIAKRMSRLPQVVAALANGQAAPETDNGTPGPS